MPSEITFETTETNRVCMIVFLCVLYTDKQCYLLTV